MKKILSFVCSCIICIGTADAAVRDGNATVRQTANTQTNQRASSSVKVSERATAARGATQGLTSRAAASQNTATKNTTPRSAINARGAKPAATTMSRAASNTVSRASTSTRSVAPNTNKRAQTPVVSRAAIDQTSSTITETRTGAAYEQCKNAYFTCMDQFCKLKNDDYRRCSCSNRVLELAEIRDVMQDAGEQLTVFTENLDVVGMTAEQANAMKTASEGENALTSDTSSSKALLNAIMNSIRGEDSTVGGKFSDLNSINLSFDTTNAFGTMDAGQAIATYNGQNLYTAVYPQCRDAVKADCNDASLQRAITAYLMAIEQDCNTVQTAIEEKQKQMKSAVRESSALLDLARVENRQKHNSDSIAACMNNVEAAILSEEVCGAGYHKCLDNGEFIDVSTGAPIAGVEKFYELGNLLKFASGVDATDQKLSKITDNRTFVQNFEKRVKKFAEPALDKCTEQADVVWEEYLDKALLDIYYAQQSKVNEIKQGCFDFVSACYMNGDDALTAAMKELTGDSDVVLQPDKVTLSTEMCRDYINSCNYMFDGDIVADYVQNRQDTDTLTACRAVAKQCFDKFGGTNYENFYYPYSGLFQTGNALDWFTLYDYNSDSQYKSGQRQPVSECAKQLQEITSCSSPEMLEKVFGGFDSIRASKGTQGDSETLTVFYLDANGDYNGTKMPKKYGLLNAATETVIPKKDGTTVNAYVLKHHEARPTGVATEIYNQIVDILSTQCKNLQGRFMELQFIKENLYQEDNLCISNFKNSAAYGDAGLSPNLVNLYYITNGENMCPRDYDLNVDTQSWGACLCWENGGRRSKWGKSTKCVAALPISEAAEDKNCTEDMTPAWSSSSLSVDNWCTQTTVSENNQICPLGGSIDDKGLCTDPNNPELQLTNLPEGITY